MIAKIAATIGGAAVVVGSVTLHDTVSLGSIFVAAAVIVAAGLFTLRNNLKSFWRDLAEERNEKIEALETQAQAALQERAKFAEEQRDIRHQLKTEIATLRAQLDVERSKHDLSSVLSRIDELEKTLDARAPLIHEIAETLTQQTKALNELVAELKQRPAR